MLTLFIRLMLMYRRLIKNFKLPKIMNSKGTNDNGYYQPKCQESDTQINKTDPVNLKLLKSLSNPQHDKSCDPMSILFLTKINSFEAQNIERICSLLNIKYRLVHLEVDAMSAVSQDLFDLIIIDCRKPKIDSDHICDKIAKNLKINNKYPHFKIVMYDDRDTKEISEIWEKGYDEQWIIGDSISSFKNYLESYLKNHYYKDIRNKVNSLVFTAFEKSSDSIEILRNDFSVEIINGTFQKIFKASLKEIKGKNWFRFHEIGEAKEEIILSELKTKKSWEGFVTFKADSHTELPINIFVVLKPLDITENHYIVTSNGLCNNPGKSEQSFSYLSIERESTTTSTPKAKESYFSSQQVSIDSPILKIMKIINSIQEISNPIVNYQLQKIIEILSSKDIFITTVDALKTDKISSNLIDGLLSNHATMFAQTENRRHSSSLTKRRQTRVNSEVIHDHITQVLAKINKMPEVPETEEIGVIDILLEDYQKWSFDILKLEELSENKPLRYIGMKVFTKFDLGSILSIDSRLFQNWLYVIETNYNDNNCYHNSTHAADVLQSSVWFLERDKINEIFDIYDDVISIIAAIIHDLGHPGRTNPFLINSSHSLAVLYNDIAVLENHHSSFAFKVTLKDDRINIFKNLNRDDYRSIRHGIIDAVLATEMAKHFEHLTKFMNTIVKPINVNLSQATNVNSSNDIMNSSFDLSDPENKAIIRRMLIKCSDVNNPTRPFYLCKEWAYRISEEYFSQTDEEINRGLPVVMPQFNRQTCDIPKSQIYFIDIFLQDMFKAWHQFADVEELLINLLENKSKWTSLSENPNDSAKTLSDNSK